MKRVYEPVDPGDGFRVLVDRLWPRGISKERAGIDLWEKEITPSTELRQDYHGGRLDWDSFSARYRAELEDGPALEAFADLIRDKDDVTLVFAGRDTDHTHVLVIVEALRERGIGA
ncbi:MAG: DUF488 family protein [Promicromonosporaceae bacterium]|nr:DUF488 family protein [Promicromonosporaceae bacterium]